MPKKRKPQRMTAKDVAKRLGVSQSTISRAFSDSSRISDAMKSRIIRTSMRLGYQPNAIARSLITRQTKIVAVVIGNLIDPFYTELLREIVDTLQSAGKQVLLFTCELQGSVETILPTLLQYQVDGIVIASAAVSSDVAKICGKRGTPILLLNQYVPGLAVHAVSCDNVQAGRDVADHLMQLGHRRFVFVAGLADTSTSLHRQKGFMDRLKERRGRSCVVVEAGEYSYDAGYKAVLHLIAKTKLPDAIFFASDVIAFGGMDALRANGIRIPEDISVVGFNDVSLSARPFYSLTTVKHPLKEMANAAISILDSEDQGMRMKAQTVFLPCRLIERTSTAKRMSKRLSAV